RLVLSIKIDIKLRQCSEGHVGHVHIAQPAIADAGDVTPIVFHPSAVEEGAFSRSIYWSDDELAFLSDHRSTGARPNQPSSNLVSQQFIQVRVCVDGCAINRDQILARFNIAERGWRQGNNLSNPQRALRLVLITIETKSQAADHRRLRAAGRSRNP